MRVAIVCPKCGRQCQAESSLLPRDVICPSCRAVWMVDAPVMAAPLDLLDINTGPSTFAPSRRYGAAYRRRRPIHVALCAACLVLMAFITAIVAHERYGVGPDFRRIVPAALVPLAPEQR